MPHIFQINVSNGGVPKLALQNVEVSGLGLAGDRHRDKNHGGPDRAVCLYSVEHILALQSEGHPIFPGSAGENLDLSGIDWAGMVPGTRLRLGECVIVELTNYTTPCNNIAGSFMEKDISRILQAKHPGWSRLYARVLQPGAISVGDKVELISR